jgi:hypothetical protein
LTEQERIDRETLLRRATAVAGAVYAAPVLTPAAAAGADACPCRANGPYCGYIKACGRGNCGCLFWNNPREMTGKIARALGHCIYMEDGLCDTFAEKHGTCPGGKDSECPEGKVCFNSCCDEHGYPPLCAECCSSVPSSPHPASRATGGPMIGWL